jgi:hypothetical protein
MRYWGLLFLLIVFISSIPSGIVVAVEGETWMDDAYPTSDVSTTLVTGSDTAHWLIVGALVIVLIIFAGVVLRRPKS